MIKFANFFNNKKKTTHITIVSGLPRSGTSLMMKMLDAGGLSPLKDDIRNADDDNPKGYYEFERVKKLETGDIDWLPDAKGKAVKVIFTLLPYLPSSGYVFKTVFMRRDITEILASQRQMLIRKGKDPDLVADEELALLYKNHIAETYGWAKRQPNFSFIEVNYNLLMKSPESQLMPLNDFLGNTLNIQNMKNILDPTLYRQRYCK